jgi:hypothetical protein
MRSRAFETRSLPSSLATTHRGFAFYVAFPKSSIRPVGLPISVARGPSAPLSLHFVEGFLENFEIAGVASLFARVLNPFLLQ